MFRLVERPRVRSDRMVLVRLCCLCVQVVSWIRLRRPFRLVRLEILLVSRLRTRRARLAMVAAEVQPPPPLPRELTKAVPGPPPAESVQWSVFVFVRSRLCVRRSALPRSRRRGLVRLILCLMCFDWVLWILVARRRVLLDLGRVRLWLVRPAQCFCVSLVGQVLRCPVWVLLLRLAHLRCACGRCVPRLLCRCGRFRCRRFIA